VPDFFSKILRRDKLNSAFSETHSLLESGMLEDQFLGQGEIVRRDNPGYEDEIG